MKSKMIAIPAVAMLLLANGSVQAASLRPTTTTGVLEGFVRDQYGKPVKGARVWVNQGSYTTQGRTDIIPIFIPKVFIGAMVFDDPNAVQNHVINGHATRTDNNGHYAFKRLASGSYAFRVSSTKQSDSSSGNQSIEIGRGLKTDHSIAVTARAAGGKR